MADYSTETHLNNLNMSKTTNAVVAEPDSIESSPKDPAEEGNSGQACIGSNCLTLNTSYKFTIEKQQFLYNNMSLSSRIVKSQLKKDIKTVICAAGIFCKHHQFEVQIGSPSHRCRVCKMILHGMVCSDEECQDMNNMRCLLCYDIAEANPKVTNLLTLQQLHEQQYTLWLASLAYDPEVIANQPDSDDNNSDTSFGLRFLQQRSINSDQYKDYVECNHPPEQGKIICKWVGKMKPGYDFDIVN